MSDLSTFVQIASYKDAELFPTLKSLTTQADHPERLRIVVCWQHGDDQTIDDILDANIDITEYEEYEHVQVDGSTIVFNKIIAELNGARVEFVDVDYTDTQGACWARNLVQQHYQNETYTLQLDSHHRFVEHWDTKVIKMLESLRSLSERPVLTGYIPSYDPSNDPKGRVMVPWETVFDRFIPEGAIFFLPRTMEDWVERDAPIRARFYSGHFTFADGHFAENVQHDPQYFFHGEEISIAARAFTHGYDLFTPHRIIAWHEYTRKGRTKVWDDHTTAAKKRREITTDWVERNNLCHKRNRILFGMDGEDPNQIDFGKYGFGKERTLREYEEYAGISFEYRGVQQATLDKLEPPNNMPYSNEEEWKDTFVGSHDVQILIHKENDLEQCIEDYDFWYVGAHDEEGEIYRKDLTASEIQTYLTDEEDWIDYRLIFLSNRKPTKFVIWPHSINKGWLERVEKDI